MSCHGLLDWEKDGIKINEMKIDDLCISLQVKDKIQLLVPASAYLLHQWDFRRSTLISGPFDLTVYPRGD